MSFIHPFHRASVFIVCDQTLLRAGHKRLVERQGGFRVVGEAEDPGRAVARAMGLFPDVAFFDLRLSGHSGLRWFERWKAVHTACRLLAVLPQSSGYVREALEAGCDGLVAHESEPIEVTMALETITMGHRYLSQLFGDRAGGSPPNSPPPQKEPPRRDFDPETVQLLRLMALGHTEREIAITLGLPPAVTRKRCHEAKRLCGCASQIEVSRFAIRMGFLPE